MTHMLIETRQSTRGILDPVGEWMNEIITRCGESLDIMLKGTDGTWQGLYRKRGEEVVEYNMPDWYVLPGEPLMDRLADMDAQNKLDSKPSLVVLVSRVNEGAVLKAYGRPAGTYIHFGHTPFVHKDSLLALRDNVLPKMGLSDRSMMSPMGVSYNPEFGTCIHFHQLVPQDYLRSLEAMGHGGMKKEELLKMYLTNSGYHSTQNLQHAEPYVRALAQIYERLRPD